MKVTEIRKEIIAFILADINLSLSRLGVSEKVEIVEKKDSGIALASKPIKQMPMMFREVIVKGAINIVKDDSIKVSEGQYLIGVGLDYRTEAFNGGRNGCEIGYIVYKADSIPEDEELGEGEIRYYIHKVRRIEI